MKNIKCLSLKSVFFTFFLNIFILSPSHSEVVDKIVAIVNKEVILSSDVEEALKNIKKPGFIDENLTFGKPLNKIDTNNHDLIDYLILEKIIEFEIQKNSYSITNERIEQEFRVIAKNSGLSEKELIGALKAQGSNVQEYKYFLKKKIEKQNLLDSEIISKIRISEEEIESELNKTNKDTFTKEFSLSHIFFNNKKYGSVRAFERAQKTLTRIKSGESFEKIALQLSEDIGFSEGGFLGKFKKGEFLPEFEKAVENLNKNEYSPVIKSKNGFHILKVMDIQNVQNPKLNADRNKIREKLMNDSFQRQLQIWIETKKIDSFIHKNP